jgi:hypothetical protein
MSRAGAFIASIGIRPALQPTLVRWFFVVATAVSYSGSSVAAEPPAGDAQAKQLTQGAMEKNYVAKDYRGAVRALGQAATLCETRGCTPPVQAQIYASLAVVHWNGTEDYDSAVEALRTMVRLDPQHALDRKLATRELAAALETAREDVRRESTSKEPPSAAPARAAPAPADSQPAADSEEEGLDPKEREFRRQVAARKAQHLREQEETRKRVEAEAAQAIIDAKREAAAQKVADAKRARQEKKDAARKLAEEKKEAARRATEQRKAEAIRLAQETLRLEAERKEADRRAIEDKKADEARKIEEAKQAREDERLKTPFKAGKLDENVWHQQALGYPLPIYVKLPPPPAGIERERTEVAKVVVQYDSAANALPQKLELTALGSGGYGGMLPCEATSQEGVITYFTIALNKYDNLVALGASPAKPHKVKVKAAIEGNAPHLPGDPPPKSCAEGGGGGGGADAGTGCTADTDCPDGGLCAQRVCASARPAPPLPAKPRWRACIGCRLGAPAEGPPAGIVLVAAAVAARLLARRRRGSRSGHPTKTSTPGPGSFV